MSHNLIMQYQMPLQLTRNSVSNIRTIIYLIIISEVSLDEKQVEGWMKSSISQCVWKNERLWQFIRC